MGKKNRPNDEGRIKVQKIFKKGKEKKKNLHRTTKDFLKVKNIKAEI